MQKVCLIELSTDCSLPLTDKMEKDGNMLVAVKWNVACGNVGFQGQEKGMIRRVEESIIIWQNCITVVTSIISKPHGLVPFTTHGIRRKHDR